jgi:hypothetical protein
METSVKYVWTSDIEDVLEKIRINCVILYKMHKKKHIQLQNTLKYYRLPIIIISALNSVISIGSQPFFSQVYISVANCLLALSCGIIGSIELYFNINKQMEMALLSSKDFHILSTDIYKILLLNPENRNHDGLVFLEDCYTSYVKLIENSGIINVNFVDELAPINGVKLYQENSSLSSKSFDTLENLENLEPLKKIINKNIKVKKSPIKPPSTNITDIIPFQFPITIPSILQSQPISDSNSTSTLDNNSVKYIYDTIINIEKIYDNNNNNNDNDNNDNNNVFEVFENPTVNNKDNIV